MHHNSTPYSNQQPGQAPLNFAEQVLGDWNQTSQPAANVEGCIEHGRETSVVYAHYEHNTIPHWFVLSTPTTILKYFRSILDF